MSENRVEQEQLLELAERCEKAAGPDQELDRAISLAITRPVVVIEKHHEVYKRPTIERIVVIEQQPYTASIDAAMTLVPDWASPGVSQNVFHQDWHAWIGRENGEGQAVDADNSHGAAPALALCAAALRARAAGDLR